MVHLHIPLIVSSTMLATVTGYAFWIPLRVARLRFDLLETHSKLMSKARAVGREHEPLVVETLQVLEAMAQHADKIGLAFLLCCIGDHEGEEVSRPECENDDDLRPWINYATSYANRRIVDYIFFETITGLILSLWLQMLSGTYREKLSNLSRKALGCFSWTSFR